MTRAALLILDTLRGSMGLTIEVSQEEGPGCLVWAMTARGGGHQYTAEDLDAYTAAALLAELVGAGQDE